MLVKRIRIWLSRGYLLDRVVEEGYDVEQQQHQGQFQIQ
jgi:hypothetical protein